MSTAADSPAPSSYERLEGRAVKFFQLTATRSAYAPCTYPKIRSPGLKGQSFGMGEFALICPENSEPRAKGKGGWFCRHNIQVSDHTSTHIPLATNLIFPLSLENLNSVLFSKVKPNKRKSRASGDTHIIKVQACTVDIDQDFIDAGLRLRHVCRKRNLRGVRILVDHKCTHYCRSDSVGGGRMLTCAGGLGKGGEGDPPPYYRKANNSRTRNSRLCPLPGLQCRWALMQP